MTPLEVQQRGLLDLLKRRGAPPVDPYLCRVAESSELAMLREIALWWRRFQLEAQCRFTSRLLRRLGIFDALSADYFNENATSPFIEELGRQFLISLRSHQDRLIRSVAQFEYAFLKVRGGSAKVFEVLWDRHPDFVFLALEEGGELPLAEQEYLYRMRMGRDIPGTFECGREPGPRTASVRACGFLS